MTKYVILMLLGQLIASASQILLKISSGKKYDSFIREYLNGFVILGYGMLVISMLISIICYNGLDYMQVVVMEPLGYIIVMFLGRMVFREKITGRKLLGMALILGGIFVYYLA